MVDVDRRTLLGGVIGVGILGAAGYREYQEQQLTGCSGPTKKSGKPVMGPSDAPAVRLFVDYSCPYCKSFVETSMEDLITSASRGDIQLQHYDFPIPVNKKWSYQVANAGRYVKDVGGNAAFWEFHRGIFSHQGSYSVKAITSEIDAVLDGDVRTGEIEQLISERPYCEEIAASKAVGEEHGIDGTPQLAIGPDWEVLSIPTVDEVLETAGVSDGA